MFFSQGRWIPIIGELFDTGVVSAIRDWNMVMESIMATPRRETMSATAAVENPCCHVSGVDEPAAEKIEKLVSNLWLRRVVSGEKRSRPCKRRDGGAVVPVWRNKMKESSRTKRKMCNHTRPECQVTYQRTITGDRNYFGHRVQENCERKENCNA